MDKKIRYGIIGFGTQGSSYCNILTGTAAFAGFPAAPVPPHCTLGAICDIDPCQAGSRQGEVPRLPCLRGLPGHDRLRQL